MYTKGNYINGTWKQSKGEVCDVISPVTDTAIWKEKICRTCKRQY